MNRELQKEEQEVKQDKYEEAATRGSRRRERW